MKKILFVFLALSFLPGAALGLTSNVSVEGRLNVTTVEGKSYVSAEAYYGNGLYLSGIVRAISFETVSGTRESTVTTTGEMLLVWARGNVEPGTAGTRLVSLECNSVVKDNIQTISAVGGTTFPFFLMYAEQPGAVTNNIAVTKSVGTIENVSIMVLKIRQ